MGQASTSTSTGTGLRKRSVVIGGHATSVTLEEAFWNGLRRIAGERGVSINALLTEIDRHHSGNLSSAVRVFVFETLARRDEPAGR